MGSARLNKTILIAGGTGTLANAMLPLILADKEVQQVRILSRGEHRQAIMQDKFKDPRMSWLLGDVADRDRIEIACRGCDEVYNFAAIKRIEAAQYNPTQAVKTNVTGSMNIVNGCIKNGVKKAIFTSTDKSVSAHTTYGASKFLAEQLHLAGNIGKHDSRFSSVLYGNIFGSQGSVILKWLDQRKNGELLTVTNPSMTRFFMTQQDAAKFVYNAMQIMDGGECFIPHMKSTDLKTIIDTIGGPYDIIGNRANEKNDELLISEDEAHLIRETDDYFIRYTDNPAYPVKFRGEFYKKHAYSSMNAPRFTQNELQRMINDHCNHC